MYHFSISLLADISALCFPPLPPLVEAKDNGASTRDTRDINTEYTVCASTYGGQGEGGETKAFFKSIRDP